MPNDAAKRPVVAARVYAAGVGGIILARGLADSTQSDGFLADVCAFLHDALQAQVAPSERSPGRA